MCQELVAVAERGELLQRSVLELSASGAADQQNLSQSAALLERTLTV